MEEPAITPAPSPPGFYSHRAFRLVFSCLTFTMVAFIATGFGSAMFNDTDPLWHLSAGDLIRQSHSIPRTDPWSFTAGNYRWLNIAWGWDIAISWLHEHGGWHAMVAINALSIASISALIFYNCLTYSGLFLPAMIATLGATIMQALSLRPLQMSHAMAALWLFLLSLIIRKQLSARWLCLFPLLMLLWVNTHGGFIVGPLLLCAFWLQAIALSERRLAATFLISLVATIVAITVNPYGLDIIEAVRRPLTTVANRFILEWQPFTFTKENMCSHIYVFLFMFLTCIPRLPLLPVERLLAVVWCVLSFTANRYLPLFAIFAAPTVACGLVRLWPASETKLSITLLNAYDKKPLAYAALVISLGISLWLPTPAASAFYKQQTLAPQTMSEEITFMARYPAIHFLTDFNLAAIVTYQTHGTIPVFVDPRTETAFPPQVLQAYLAFYKGLPGWESILSDYGISGAVLSLTNQTIIQRFHALPGWYPAFTGPTAIIFLRQ